MVNKNKNNTIFWIIGIVVLLIVITKLPLPGFPFAVITKTTCVDKTLSYWDFDGNVLDSNNLNNGINNGGLFVPGKIGQGIEFNTTTYLNLPTISSENKTIIMWIKNYSTGSDWYFASETSGVGGSNKIIPLDSQFGLGFNGSVDEMAVFSPALTSEELSNFSVGIKVCYTTTYEKNISCKDYSTEQFTDPGTGCLNYSGDFWPNCEYSWEATSGFYVFGGECIKRFYCENILSSDFSNLTLCQDILITEELTGDTPATPSITPPVEETFKDKLNKDVFKIGGFGVKLIYLIIALIVVVALIYFMKDGKK